MRGSTASCSAELARLRAALSEADAVVIGAGAGLSAAAGFAYDGARFRENFADFIERYHVTDMYAAGFYPYASPEEFWAYWSRYVLLNRYEQPPGELYAALLELVRGRDYFVITTNVDHCFQRAGFERKRLFYTQGDYGLFQCAKPCHEKTYDNETAIRQMASRQSGLRVPAELLPRCPVCGGPMSMNLRCDDTFVQDEGWYRAALRYERFLEEHSGARVLYLELGVGYNTPGIIKFSFWRMAAENKNARYACLNLGEATAPRELGARAICIDADLADAIRWLK
ncbi:Sir2 silent information regulator family NAD-dependent deacetylase [Clostridiales bacterium BX7]|uniref:protein acetyllysine N-acetyltransferase n=2 Tax=Feifania hominis TaxID=2763660 RepID=A0A926DD03_9FIRM|nr:Sir2 silent information regulator family NAD-dependent deacetylase [Feifania hominis]